MKIAGSRSALLLAIGLASGAGGQPIDPSLPLSTAASWRVRFYDVRLELTEKRARLSGRLLRSSIDPERRAFRDVWVEVIGPDGAVIALRRGDARRSSFGSHCVRGRFEIRLEDLPPNAASLRLGYGWRPGGKGRWP